MADVKDSGLSKAENEDPNPAKSSQTSGSIELAHKETEKKEVEKKESTETAAAEPEEEHQEHKPYFDSKWI